MMWCAHSVMLIRSSRVVPCVCIHVCSDAVQCLNEFLPEEHRIDYLAWDFKKVSKNKHLSVVSKVRHTDRACAYPHRGAVYCYTLLC